MKKYFLFLYLTTVCFAQNGTVDSKVIKATIFKDPALVTGFWLLVSGNRMPVTSDQ